MSHVTFGQVTSHPNGVKGGGFEINFCVCWLNDGFNDFKKTFHSKSVEFSMFFQYLSFIFYSYNLFCRMASLLGLFWSYKRIHLMISIDG